MRVLIVDDEPGICRRLQRELRKEGCEVEYTTSAIGVLERLKKAEQEGKAYALLLLDLRMPKVDGLSLLKEIREAQLDLDVVIITGYGDEDKATESIRLGAVDYLCKSISLEALHTTVFRVQQKRAAEEKRALEYSILVVDDEKELCARIKRELDKEGYRAAVAYDGMEGLDYFSHNRVDVAIVDIKMPRMSGLEMLEKCREITDDFVSIIITGHGDHERAIQALQLGVFSYLRKPISLEELVTSVGKGIEVLQLRRGLAARRRELEIETALKEQYAQNLERMVEEGTKEIKKLAGAVKASTDSIVISDLEGRITDVNEATLKMYGTGNKEDLVGKSSFDLIAPEDRERAIAGMQEALEKGYAKGQGYVVTKDGSRLLVEMSVSIMKGVDGEPIGFVGIIRDITERVRAEETLQAERAQLISLFDSIDEIIYVADMDTHEILYANKALQKAFQKSLIGEICYKEFQGLDQPCEFCTNPIIKTLNYQPYHWEYHNPLLNADFHITDRVIKWPDGRDVRFEIALDITERKQAEKVQAAIYRISQAAVSSENLDEFYASLHYILSDLMPVENFYVALYDPGSDLLSFPYFVDQYDQPPLPKKPARGLSEYVLRTGQPLLAPPEVFDHLLQQGEVELMGANSVDWLGVPLKVKGHVIGVMVTQSYTEGIRFSQEDADLLGYVSTQAAQAIERKRTEEEIKQRNRELAILNALATVVSQSLNLDEILNASLDKVLELMHLDVGGIYLADPVRRKLDLVAHRGISKEFAQAIESISVDEKTLEAVIAEGRLRRFILSVEAIIKDRAELKRVVSAMKKEGLSLTFSVPVLLQAKEEIPGLMILASRVPRHFSEAELGLLTSISQQIAIAIENARLYQETRYRAKELEALAEIDQVIISTLDLAQVLKTIATQATIISQSDEGGIFELDKAADVFRITASYDTSEAFIRAVNEANIKVGQGAIGMAAATRKPAQVADTEAESGYRFQEIAAIDGIRSVLAVPMLKGEELIGGIVLWRRRPGRFSDQDVRLISTFATQAVIAIENARMYERERQARQVTESLRETMATLVSSLELDQVLDRILDEVQHVVPHDAANIALVEASTEPCPERSEWDSKRGDTVRFVRWLGYERLGVDTEVPGLGFRIADTPNYRYMAETGQPKYSILLIDSEFLFEFLDRVGPMDGFR